MFVFKGIWTVISYIFRAIYSFFRVISLGIYKVVLSIGRFFLSVVSGITSAVSSFFIFLGDHIVVVLALLAVVCVLGCIYAWILSRRREEQDINNLYNEALIELHRHAEMNPQEPSLEINELFNRIARGRTLSNKVKDKVVYHVCAHDNIRSSSIINTFSGPSSVSYKGNDALRWLP